ncbi:hypothetical protein [Agrobacterium tumefaciens]|uniref:hypothetical protein n=1 Tax=Agrobacterium tumefaciens TaxID=358 RepID=UPI002A14DE24|nr:hypothetical protein [Agrobacterium tumefaciens]MDX8327535.1 hypothetical protein [Agrobacterium tumefaciens]
MTQFYINLRKPSTCFTYYGPGDMIGPKRAAAQPARSDPGVNLVHPVFLSPVHDMGKAAVDTDFHGQHSADDALITVDVSGFHRQEIIDATATD